MAWQDEAIPILRSMLLDLDETSPTYSDDNLEKMLLVAAGQVLVAVTFDQDFEVSVANLTLTPDPTVGDNKNPSFVNLMTLKAAAILDRGEAVLAAKRGVVVKDGSSAIDLSKVAEARRKLLERGGFNAAYDEAKLEYQYQRTQGVAGAAVMSPFRLFAWETFGSSGSLGCDPRDRNNFFN